MKADLEICRLLNDALAKAEDERVKTAVLEIQVNATLAGHDLGPFEPAEVLTGGNIEK